MIDYTSRIPELPLAFQSKFVIKDMPKPDHIEGPCWLWIAAKDEHRGYGYFKINGKQQMIHRYSYRFFKGAIPDGLVIHHECENTDCCNPHHLSAVTQQHNVLVGCGPTSINASKTHCKHGHELSGYNVIIVKKGRHCRTCCNANQRKFKQKMRERKLDV